MWALLWPNSLPIIGSPRLPFTPQDANSHTQTAAKLPGFSPTAQGFTAETDSPLEGDGFELVVPRHKSRGFRQHPGLIEGFETTDHKIQQKRCLTACGSLKRKKPQPGQIAYAIVSMEWLA